MYVYRWSPTAVYGIALSIIIIFPTDISEHPMSKDCTTISFTANNSAPHDTQAIPSVIVKQGEDVIDSLRIQYELTYSNLDAEIETQDMPYLAKYFDNDRKYFELLGLNPSEQNDIKLRTATYDTRTAMIQALELWKKHNPYAATHRKLIKMFIEMDNREGADGVCIYLRDKSGIRHIQNVSYNKKAELEKIHEKFK